MARAIAASALVLALAAGAAIGAKPPVGTAAGVYTEEQAEQGSQLYAQRCAMCHGKQLQGSYEIPELKGQFIANWGKRPLGDLYDYLGRAMPQFAPGSLTPDDNARLVAFMLKANGMPAGSKPLAADSAALHKILVTPASPAP